MDVDGIMLRKLAGECPRLSRDEEILVGAAIKAGLRASRLLRLHHSLPSAPHGRADFVSAETLEWTGRQVATIRAGIAARNRLVLSCLPWAIKTAAKFAARHGVRLDAYAGEAQLALFDAAADYDAERCRFSTYSWQHVRKRIMRDGIYETQTIRVPITSMGNQTTRRAAEAARCIATIGDDCADRRVVVLGAADTAAEDRDWDEYRLKIVRAAMRHLDARIRGVILARASGDTLQEIGDRMNITKERARQLEASGLRYLRKFAKDRIDLEAKTATS